MTDVVSPPTPTHPSARSRVLRFVRRIRATLVAVLVIVGVGVVSTSVWRPFARHAAWDRLAYGLPAFAEGRWWTPLTGTLLVSHPWLFILTVAGFWGMAYLEFRRGWRVALAYFAVGQLFAMFATALLLWLLAFTPSSWAHAQSVLLDSGPSGGTFACMAAAIGLFASPWRTRGWLVLLAFLSVTVLFSGSVNDIEHALAALLILAVDRSLRIQRSTVREQRLVAFVVLVGLGITELIVLLGPTDGPFGQTRPASGSLLDILSDVVVIVLAADGLRRGRRWAWVVTIVLAAVNVLTGTFIAIAVSVLGWGAVTDLIDGAPSLSLATSVLWLTLLVYVVIVRRAFRGHRRYRLGRPPTPNSAEVKDVIHRHGGGTLSWMTTWTDNSYARTRAGIVAYQRRAGVAIVLGDPLGPPSSRAASAREFIDDTERAGLIPCFFSASEDIRRAMPAGWQSLAVADDTIVDLPGLEFTGKRWNSVRTSLNRAVREEISFRLTRLRDEPWGIHQQVRAISEMWVGDRGLPEMGFTLGTLAEAEDPEVKVALAVSAQGDVDGFLSWMPIYRGDGSIRGWTLDLMRRREGGFGAVMEFLIASSARVFRDEGAEIMSLSGAPLAHDYPPGAGVMADLSTRLSEALEPVYGFRSLHRFKEKFQPRYETLYLLYRDPGDLTRIAAGLTRAFLPDATLRQFAGAGIDLMRGEKD